MCYFPGTTQAIQLSSCACLHALAISQPPSMAIAQSAIRLRLPSLLLSTLILVAAGSDG